MNKILVVFILLISSQLHCQDALFGPDNVVTYAVRISIQNISIRDTVEISVSDKPWHRQPDKQYEMIIRYHIDPTDTTAYKDISSIGWVEADTSGAVDNSESCWFHPPRHNYYRSLELAPFPRVEFPLESGKEYQRMLFIGEGWGELSNSKVRWHYRVENRKFGVWNIHAEAIVDGDEGLKNELHFTYNEESGFGDLFYIFSDGTSFVFSEVPKSP
jgi:hypothetical protein